MSQQTYIRFHGTKRPGESNNDLMDALLTLAEEKKIYHYYSIGFLNGTEMQFHTPGRVDIAESLERIRERIQNRPIRSFWTKGHHNTRIRACMWAICEKMPMLLPQSDHFQIDGSDIYIGHEEGGGLDLQTGNDVEFTMDWSFSFCYQGTPDDGRHFSEQALRVIADHHLVDYFIQTTGLTPKIDVIASV